jgi:3',5'-cyclic AMP phosphodiesterase CpdA
MAPRIGILPDIHMRTPEREAVTAQLEETVKDLREADPDLIVPLGDVIQHGETVEEDIENLEHVKDLLSRFDCPVRYMAGNHEVMNLSQDRLAEVFGNELWGRTTIDGETLIFLDTSAPWLSGSRGEATEEQLTFLDDTLAETERATIFIHHPIHYHNVEDTYWWSEYPERAFCGNKKEINRIMDEYDSIRAVVNGHLHDPDMTRYRGVPHLTLNAFSKETREKAVTGTYAIMDIAEEIAVEIVDKDGRHDTYSF